jgi:hypothetical protein
MGRIGLSVLLQAVEQRVHLICGVGKGAPDLRGQLVHHPGLLPLGPDRRGDTPVLVVQDALEERCRDLPPALALGRRYPGRVELRVEELGGGEVAAEVAADDRVVVEGSSGAPTGVVDAVLKRQEVPARPQERELDVLAGGQVVSELVVALEVHESRPHVGTVLLAAEAVDEGLHGRGLHFRPQRVEGRRLPGAGAVLLARVMHILLLEHRGAALAVAVCGCAGEQVHDELLVVALLLLLVALAPEAQQAQVRRALSEALGDHKVRRVQEQPVAVVDASLDLVYTVHDLVAVGEAVDHVAIPLRVCSLLQLEAVVALIHLPEVEVAIHADMIGHGIIVVLPLVILHAAAEQKRPAHDAERVLHVRALLTRLEDRRPRELGVPTPSAEALELQQQLLHLRAVHGVPVHRGRRQRC